jgi:sortase A
VLSRDVLRWIEHGLWVIGVALALWCAVVLVNARRTRNMPVPAPSSARTLPADAGDNPATAFRPPSAGAWVARLEAPRIKLSATVLEGTDDRTLARGAGHIEDTAFPGQPGNVGIAGHRDTTFRPVRRIKVGDPLLVTTPDRVFEYRVTKTFIVGPDDVYVLDPADHSTLTLVTCYPFEFIGHAPKRFIVSADLERQEGREGLAGPEGLEKAERPGRDPAHPANPAHPADPAR